MTQAEILPMETGKVAVYNPFRSQLVEIKKQNSLLVFDYESPSGNKEARSHIHKLRKTKAAVEETRKKAKQDSLEYGRMVDGEAKEITAELESMISVHQIVIDEIEQRETKRIEAIQAKIANIVCYQQCAGHDSQETAIALEKLKAMAIEEADFGEFKAEANIQLELSIKAQEAEHIKAVKREEDARELEKLRKEAAERAQRERDEKLQTEAAEKARIAAEIKAKAEIEKAEREKQDAEDRAKKAESDRMASEERAKILALQAEEKAKRDAEAAVQREKERAKFLKAAEMDASLAREADKKHKAKINNEALHVLKNLVDEEKAKAIIEAIAKGHIPNVKIIY